MRECNLNEFIKDCKDSDCKGIYVDEIYKDVNMLLYADDLVLVGDSIGRVQKLLNMLSDYCKKWGLKVNMGKTKMIVYRNGGIVKNCEKCYFDGVKIEIVKYYKYLGVVFSSRLSWSPAQALLSSQGSKAMFLINKANYQYEFPYNTSRTLFEKCITPIVTYGSQIWGTQVNQSTESVLISFCKKQLGVGSTTPSVAVLGECGMFPLYLQCYENVIKYWLKLVSLEGNSLLKSCYKMLYDYERAGRKNWAKDVKELLYMYGFGFVWEQQGIDDVGSFLRVFKERVRDCYMQKWNAAKLETPKLYLYNLFKHNFEPEPYLLINIPRRLRRCLARFRTTSASLEIEIGRRHNIPREDRLCRLCGMSNQIHIEDEYHVLLECPSYATIRDIYLENTTVNLFSFVSIMESDDNIVLTKLANFISYALDVRQNMLKT